MTGMGDARRQAVADLEAVGLKVEDHVPEKVVPPLVFLRAGSPMLEETSTFDPDERLYRLELMVIIKNKPNAAAIEDLESIVEKVVFNLGDWTVGAVGQPFMAQHNGSEYPAVWIELSKTIHINGGA